MGFSVKPSGLTDSISCIATLRRILRDNARYLKGRVITLDEIEKEWDEEIALVNERYKKRINNTLALTIHIANYYKFRWLRKPETLKLLYSILQEHSYIQKCTWEYFLAHFDEDIPIVGEITFLQETNKLAHLFDWFIDKNLFIEKPTDPHRRLSLNFFDKTGNEITYNVARQSADKKIGRQAKARLIEEIMIPLAEAEGMVDTLKILRSNLKDLQKKKI